jgi:hypothetical protein
MTEFQQKRLEYFIKTSENGEWVRLGTEDSDLFKSLKDHVKYDEGFNAGIEYVVSGQMEYDYQKEDALKDTH